MKKTIPILGAILVAGSLSALAQGTIRIDTTANTGVFNGAGGVAFNPLNSTGNPTYSAAVTQNGLIFTMDNAASWGAQGGPAGSQMLGVDVNFALFGGATAQTATTLITSLTGVNITGDNVNWGQLQLPSGAVQNVPGTTANSTVFLDLQVWEGSAANFASSGSYKADSGVFANPSGGGASAPLQLTGLPDMLLTIPEPSTFALAGLGAAALMIFRRRK